MATALTWRMDDFKFFENGVTAPVAGFSVNSNAGTCTSDTIVFTSTSSGTITSYSWDFGVGATPATATTAGPHSVVYSVGGTKQVTLDVSNSGGTNKATNSIVLKDVPSTSFVFSVSGLTVNFSDGSSFNPTAWNWDFGDGNGSTQQNPSHTYVTGGTYPVTLRAINDCGFKDYVDTLKISGIGLEEDALMAVSLYPNPTEGLINLSVPASLNIETIQITDISGKAIRTMDVSESEDELHLDLRDFAEGIYMIELNTDEGSRTFRVIKK